MNFCNYARMGPSPHFSHSMWDIGQARRRTLSASSTGPLGCLSAGISSVGRLNRMPRYAFRRPTLYLPRRKSNADRMECEKCGLGRRKRFGTDFDIVGGVAPRYKHARKEETQRVSLS